MIDMLPVRPEMRVVTSNEFEDYRLVLLEQPDISVDEPYTLIVISRNKAMGIGHSAMSYSTKTEPMEIRDRLLKRYLNLPEKRYLAAIIEDVKAAVEAQE